MPLAARRSGQSALCAFQIAEWLAPSIGSCRGNRYRSNGAARVRRRVKVEEDGRKDQHFPFSSSLITSGDGETLEVKRVPSGKELPFKDTRGVRHLNFWRLQPPGQPINTKSRSKDMQPQFEKYNKYHLFSKVVAEQYESMLRTLVYIRPDGRFGAFHLLGKTTCTAWGIKSTEELQARSHAFERTIRDCMKLARSGITGADQNPLFARLRAAFVKGDTHGLEFELKFSLLHSIFGDETENTSENQKTSTRQKKLADMRYPTEWYPATRALQRTIHLHVGPTNSGKTYHALKRLEAAESGIFAGPLRLLAHEVYTRFNAKGKPCALVTGEERRFPPGLTNHMTSCTVEMVPLNTKVDVAVIDEIQMMGDPSRGWAWTQAFLGVQAKEVHLCGEIRTIELITELCAAIGDELIIHRYDRLGPLEMQGESINGDLTKLEKGDAVILFSRLEIHAMKKRIEEATGKCCAVVYGSLPAETRAQQANLFNDPDNEYDFLVASDAVGMGLNLSIKRVIFESTWKFDGIDTAPIPVSQVKQIAGRAGRFKTARDAIVQGPTDLTDGQSAPEIAALQNSSTPNVGLITTLNVDDYEVISDAMKTDVKPLASAGLFPPAQVIRDFASYFPSNTPFSYIIMRLYDLTSISPRFHLCNPGVHIQLADILEPYDLSINDRIVFLNAPVNLRANQFVVCVSEFARTLANQSSGHLLDMQTLNIEILAHDIDYYAGGSAVYLRKAELLHQAITCYLWLSYRFSGVFQSQALAFHIQSLVEQKIDECLKQVNWTQVKDRREQAARRSQSFKDQAARAAIEKAKADGDWTLDTESLTQEMAQEAETETEGEAEAEQNVGSLGSREAILENVPRGHLGHLATQEVADEGYQRV